MVVKGFGRCLPIEAFPGTAIKSVGDSIEVGPRMLRQVRAFWEVLAKQAVGVLIGASLPWTVRVAEEDR